MNENKGYNIQRPCTHSYDSEEFRDIQKLRRLQLYYFRAGHVNKNGGFLRLLKIAGQNKTQREAAQEFGIPEVYIEEYLGEQNLSWRDLLKEVLGG